MPKYIRVTITVPDNYTEDNELDLVEEAIAIALAELNGDTLSPHFDGDGYNAAISPDDWES